MINTVSDKMSQAAAALKQKRKNANQPKVPFTVPDLSKVEQGINEEK